MTRLNVSLDLHSWQLAPQELPVEVRRENAALVRRALSTEAIDVDPGRYFVSTKLPSGVELHGEVEVGDNEAWVRLTPDPEDESPRESFEVPLYIWGRGSRTAEPTSLEIAFEKHVRLLLFEGNVLRDRLSVPSQDGAERIRPMDRSNEPPPDIGVFSVVPAGPAFVQLVQSGSPPINVALAAGGGRARPETFALVASRQGERSFDLEVRLWDSPADTLLAYAERSLIAEAAEVMRTAELSEELLLHKRQHPVAAAVGALSLLRLGELKRLHDWTRNLCNWFPLLPDGLAIRAEHLARLGQREEALELLLELPSRGLPVLADSFSYAEQRLAEAVADADRQEAQASQAARALLGRLRKYAPFIDFQRSFLTFTGANPGAPGEEPLTEPEFAGMAQLPVAAGVGV